MNPSGQQSDEEKILTIREYKEKGNAAYKAGQYKKAAGNYHRALLYFKGLSINCPDLLSSLSSMAGDGATPHQPGPKMSPDQETDVKSLSCDCYNNIAACLLKESEPKYERVVELCDKALDVSPGNVKALYRKGTAQYALRNYDEALATLQQAPQGDLAVKKYVDLCKQGIKKQEGELAKCYKEMFKFS